MMARRRQILPSRKATGVRIGIKTDAAAEAFAFKMVALLIGCRTAKRLREVAPQLRETFAELASRRTGWDAERRAKARRLAAAGASAREIGAALGTTGPAVVQQVNTNGTPGRKPGNHEAYCHTCGIGGTLAEIRLHYREVHKASASG
jgi:hypothetical protein